MYLSWIIPAYNEERRIEKTLREVDHYLRSRIASGLLERYEIIVANSASKDRTAAIVRGLAQEITSLSLVEVANRGKGWAVRSGILQAHGDIRLFSDADNSTAPEYFDAMAPLFRQGYDVVISSRDSKDAPGATRDIKEPWYREILGNVGNLIIQVFGVWGIWDTQNGFKAFSARSASAIFPEVRMAGFSFDIEVLALARRFKFRLGVIPIRWRHDPDSTLTLGAYVKVFVDVFRIRWNFIRGAYRRS